MAIKFICTCGKHLRARDEMAARRAFCPRCGNPVGIPSLQPTHVGTPAHVLTPAERLRRRVQAPRVDPPVLSPPEPAEAPLSAAVPEPPDFADPSLVTLRSAEGLPASTPTRRRRRTSAGAEPWVLRESLPWFYASRALLIVLVLALALTAATGLVVSALPEALDSQMQSQGPWPAVLLGGLPLAILAYYCAVLHCAFASAAAGEVWLGRWPMCDLDLVLRSTARCLFGFLAGPIVPAAVGLLFWLNSGDLALIDRLILAELGLATIAYWVLVVAAVSDSNRLRDASPPKLVGFVSRMGWRMPGAVVPASALLLADGLLGWSALEEIAESPGRGLLLLGGASFGGMVGLIFLFHLLGRWCHRSHLAKGPDSEAHSAAGVKCSQ
jgi:hypothetical protein